MSAELDEANAHLHPQEDNTTCRSRLASPRGLEGSKILFDLVAHGNEEIEAQGSVPMHDIIDELDDTVFLDCVALIAAEARDREGPPAPWDSKVLDTPAEHRLSRRRPVIRRIGLTVRPGTLGLGPDLGSGLVDAAEDGLGIKLKAPVVVGSEVTIDLSVPGINKPQRMVAEVRWCQAAGDGTFRAGVRLRRRLPYTVLSDLTR